MWAMGYSRIAATGLLVILGLFTSSNGFVTPHLPTLSYAHSDRSEWVDLTNIIHGRYFFAIFRQPDLIVDIFGMQLDTNSWLITVLMVFGLQVQYMKGLKSGRDNLY